MMVQYSSFISKKMTDFTFTDIINRLFLAGIGFIAMKHDDLEAYIDQLEARGLIAKNDLSKAVNQKDKRCQGLSIRQDFHETADKLLKRMNIPRRSDIEEISREIMLLEKKINELSSKNNLS